MSERGETPVPKSIPPTYWECRRILSRLRDFRDLVRHRFHVDVHRARPIESILEGADKLDPADQRDLMEERLNYLKGLVAGDLEWARIPTSATVPNKSVDDRRRLKWKDQEYDLVQNLFEIYRLPQSHLLMKAAVRQLEEALGIYEAIKRRAWRQLFSPITWAAWVIRIPLAVLDRAGLLSEATVPPVAKIVIELMWVVLLVILTSKWAGMPPEWIKVLVDRRSN